MSVKVEVFKQDPYKLISLKNNNITVVLTNIGASIVSIILKDKNNNLVDIVLGYNDPKGYLKNIGFLGATVGRNANRIENGYLKIDDKIFYLDKNDNGNNLHSGFEQTGELLWNYKICEEENSVKFYTTLKDGFQKMEGNFDIGVTYSLKDDNSLQIDYEGVCDKKTVANFTNHTYFNLNGHNSGDILFHKVMINSQTYTPFKENTNIPNGNMESVANTPMDFRTLKYISEDIDKDFDQLKYVNGYDHNYVIEDGEGVRFVCKAYSEKTGISLETYSDLPGLQFYTGNNNNITEYTKENAKYTFRTGFCFETQYFPNCYNVENFKKPIIEANEKYMSTTIYKFILE